MSRFWNWIKGFFHKEPRVEVLKRPIALTSYKQSEIRRKARKKQREARRKNR